MLCPPGVDLSAEEFWEKLLGGANVRTSQPSPQMFISVFEEALKNKEEAIYLGLSSALSGTIQSARLAVSMIGSKGIHILDTLENLARSGCIPKAAASLGTPAKLKPLLEVSPEGGIVLCEHSAFMWESAIAFLCFAQYNEHILMSEVNGWKST